MNREQWLAERKKGLGGSDVASLFGFGYRHTPLTLWLEKSGLQEPPPTTREQSWGQRVESAILDEYRARMGDQIANMLRFENDIIEHPTKPFLLGSLDAEARDAQRNWWIVDAKNVITFNRAEWGIDGGQKCPKGYAIQMLHYMGLRPAYSFAHLAALLGGSDLRVILVPRREKLIAKIQERAEEFWVNHVLAGVPPPPDFAHSSALATAEFLHPKNENRIELSLTPAAARAMARLMASRSITRAAERMGDAAKAELITMTAGAAEAMFTGGVVYKRGRAITIKLPKWSDTSPDEEIDLIEEIADLLAAQIERLPYLTGDKR